MRLPATLRVSLGSRKGCGEQGAGPDPTRLIPRVPVQHEALQAHFRERGAEVRHDWSREGVLGHQQGALVSGPKRANPT